MNIEIDSSSGFCYGVTHTVELAEQLVKENQPVYCLGEIVHNAEEVNRLRSIGVTFITRDTLETIYNSAILLRTHGEPLSTYACIQRNNNRLIDGTCSIVKALQKKVEMASSEMRAVHGQVVLYGKKDHAEVVGIMGQGVESLIVVNEPSDLDQIDFSRPVALFSQTTQPMDGFKIVGEMIRKRMTAFFGEEQIPLKIINSVCRHVSKRGIHLAEFAKKYDTLIFISGKNSSNGKILFGVCNDNNRNAHWISKNSELQEEWFTNALSVGICGATSTPRWQLEEIKESILRFQKENE